MQLGFDASQPKVDIVNARHNCIGNVAQNETARHFEGGISEVANDS